MNLEDIEFQTTEKFVKVTVRATSNKCNKPPKKQKNGLNLPQNICTHTHTHTLTYGHRERDRNKERYRDRNFPELADMIVEAGQ